MYTQVTTEVTEGKEETRDGKVEVRLSSYWWTIVKGLYKPEVGGGGNNQGRDIKIDEHVVKLNLCVNTNHCV